jgi:type IV pilus assembly protein PilX
MRCTRPRTRISPRQHGVSLILVLIILTVVSLLGVAAIQVSLLTERGARNDRDMQLAWQSAEAALADAEVDLWATKTSTNSRQLTFQKPVNTVAFVPGCGTSSTNRGLCELVSSGKPAWLTVDFTATGSAAPTVEYGTFTGAAFTAGGLGVQPAQKPRYVIEIIPDPGERDASVTDSYIFRVTAMGFGPRKEIQAVVQMLYRN